MAVPPDLKSKHVLPNLQGNFAYQQKKKKKSCKTAVILTRDRAQYERSKACDN